MASLCAYLWPCPTTYWYVRIYGLCSVTYHMDIVLYDTSVPLPSQRYEKTEGDSKPSRFRLFFFGERGKGVGVARQIELGRFFSLFFLSCCFCVVLADFVVFLFSFFFLIRG